VFEAGAVERQFLHGLLATIPRRKTSWCSLRAFPRSRLPDLLDRDQKLQVHNRFLATSRLMPLRTATLKRSFSTLTSWSPSASERTLKFPSRQSFTVRTSPVSRLFTVTAALLTPTPVGPRRVRNRRSYLSPQHSGRKEQNPQQAHASRTTSSCDPYI